MNEIICADAVPWLRAQAEQLEVVVTSLPDASEIGAGVDDWAAWFADAVSAVVDASENAVFYQTDRKQGGRLHSKAALVIGSAEAAGAELLWHRIVLRRAVGATDLHRPTYAHLIAVTKSARPGRAVPDVIGPSRSLYPNGMPEAAARCALTWVVGQGYRHVTDPFCGRGTVPYYAREYALGYTAVDIDPAQVERTEQLLAQAVITS